MFSGQSEPPSRPNELFSLHMADSAVRLMQCCGESHMHLLLAKKCVAFHDCYLEVYILCVSDSLSGSSPVS